MPITYFEVFHVVIPSFLDNIQLRQSTTRIKRIPLAKSSRGDDLLPQFPIDDDGIVRHRYTTQNASSPLRLNPSKSQYVLMKVPINHLGFFNVQIDGHPVFLSPRTFLYEFVVN